MGSWAIIYVRSYNVLCQTCVYVHHCYSTLFKSGLNGVSHTSTDASSQPSVLHPSSPLIFLCLFRLQGGNREAVKCHGAWTYCQRYVGHFYSSCSWVVSEYCTSDCMYRYRVLLSSYLHSLAISAAMDMGWHYVDFLAKVYLDIWRIPVQENG